MLTADQNVAFAPRCMPAAWLRETIGKSVKLVEQVAHAGGEFDVVGHLIVALEVDEEVRARAVIKAVSGEGLGTRSPAAAVDFDAGRQRQRRQGTITGEQIDLQIRHANRLEANDVRRINPAPLDRDIAAEREILAHAIIAKNIRAPEIARADILALGHARAIGGRGHALDEVAHDAVEHVDFNVTARREVAGPAEIEIDGAFWREAWVGGQLRQSACSKRSNSVGKRKRSETLA